MQVLGNKCYHSLAILETIYTVDIYIASSFEMPKNKIKIKKRSKATTGDGVQHI